MNNLYLLKCYQPSAEGINIICYAGSKGKVCAWLCVCMCVLYICVNVGIQVWICVCGSDYVPKTANKYLYISKQVLF